jgi:hypothetical protein
MRTRILLPSALLLTSTVALAQTPPINGTIRDGSGLAIPGATVKATQTATGVSRTAISGADGVMCSRIFPSVLAWWSYQGRVEQVRAIRNRPGSQHGPNP